MKLKALAALTAVAAATLFAPTAADAAVRPAATCTNFIYSFTTNSTKISATATPACAGEGSTWMILERKNSYGAWDYLTDTSSPPTTPQSLTYYCHGTTTNTYQIGPIFPTNGGTYSFYQFTDACG